MDSRTNIESKVNNAWDPTQAQFSFFWRPVMNKRPCEVFDLRKVYNYITGPQAQAATEALRAEPDEGKQREMKKVGFNYVTFSGIFSYCSDDCLLQHSGLLCLDFDHLGERFEELRQQLLADQYFDTMLLFRSPRGNGLKWVIHIDLTGGTHRQWFRGVQAYVRKKYGLEVDEKCINESRACFLPYDPEAMVTKKVLPF